MFKSFAAWSFVSYMACDKNWSFFILYEKYWMSSCTTCLMRNSDILISLAMALINLLRSLSIMAWISPRNPGVLFLSEWSECDFQAAVSCNHYPPLFESSALFSDWLPNAVKSLYWSIWCECQPEQHGGSKFLKQWIVSWYCFPYSHQLWLHRRQNLKKSTSSK